MLYLQNRILTKQKNLAGIFNEVADMFKRQIFIAFIFATVFTFILNICNLLPVVHAEVHNYTGVGKCIMSDFESADVVKMRAAYRAEKDAKLKINAYFRSQNGALSNDEIAVITNANIEVANIDYKKLAVEAYEEAGIMYEANVKVNIDTNAITNYLRLDENEKINLINRYNSLQKIIDSNEKAADDLRNLAKSAQNKLQIKSEFEKIDNEFLSNQKNEEGLNLYFKGKYIEAIERYNEAIQININNFIAYSYRGSAYFMIKNYTFALADFNKAIELNPKDDLAYNNRGYLYANMKQYDKALIDINKVIELKPNNALAYNNRGAIYQVMKNNDKALEDYNRAIDLDNTLALAYSNRGNYYRHLAEYQRAIVDFNKVIKLNPNFNGIYGKRGICHSLVGNFRQAIEDFTKAIELDPNKKYYYEFRGQCYKAIGEESLAEADFAEAAKLSN